MQIDKYLKKITQLVLDFSIYFNLPSITAYLFFLSTRYSSSGNKKYKILYLSKSVFNLDVEALIERNKYLAYYGFPRIYLNRIVNKFLKNFDELNDGNYHILVNDKVAINKLRNFLGEFIDAYRKHLHFDAVLAGNFVYTQQQELFWVLRSKNIPIIVIYKEGMFPINSYDDMIDIFYRTKVFRANKILFYNQKIRDTLLKSQIPGLQCENTAIVGIPRLDEYFEIQDTKTDENLIVLFSFDPQSKAEYLLKDKSKFNDFVKIVDDFHKLFIQFCVRNDDYKLIVKSKPNPTGIKYTKNIFAGAKKLLGNRLIISSSINPSKLIREAQYIAGYSSTTLIESMLLKKVLICPCLSDIVDPKTQDILHPYTALANYIRSFEELEKTILNKDKHISNEIIKQKYLKEIIYQPDGLASCRVENEIIKQIES